MGKFIDITGQRFGRLVTISHESIITSCGRKKIHWLCRCNCGNQRKVEVSNLKNGHTTSCGCSRIGNPGLVTHGMRKTRTYHIYYGMKDRCNNKNANNYDLYGGRGIKICDHWHNFSNFFADMGECPEKLTIERIDNSLGYSKENCKWATHKEQQNNTRRNVFITHNGETLTLAQWSDRSLVKYKTFHARIRYQGWTMDRALSEN